jgi:hypothetical protein
MSCDGYEAILKNIALGAPATSEVDAHLDECVRCRDWLADERRLLAAVQWTLEGPMDAKPSEDFLGQVRKRLAREQMVRSWEWPAWMATVAASIAIALGVTVYRSGEVAKEGPPAHAVVMPQSPATTVTTATSSPSRTSVRRHAWSAAPAQGVTLEVLVEPGQHEALAQAVRAVSDDRGRPTFVVVSLDGEAPLPPLRSRDLPRFETKRLEVKSVFDGNERGGL